MSVTRVILHKCDTGGGKLEKNGLLAEILRRNYVAELIAICNTHRMTSTDVLNSVLIPNLGDTFSLFGTIDLLATCVDLKAERTAHPMVWLVTVLYDTDRLASLIIDNPLNQPPDVNYGTMQIERPLLRGIDGTLIMSSSKERLDPPFMYREKRATVQIALNQAAYDAVQAAAYVDACNSDYVVGLGSVLWPPYTVKCTVRTGHRQISFGEIYYQVATELEFRPVTYAEFYLDQAYRQLKIGDNKKRELIRDPVDFSLPGNPTLLNGRGRPIWEATALLTAGTTNVATNIFLDGGLLTKLKFPPGPTIAGGFFRPPHYYYWVRVEDEIMQVTADSLAGGWNITVLRGQIGTTAVAHAAKTEMTLEPYFMFTYPANALPFAALSLPAF